MTALQLAKNSTPSLSGELFVYARGRVAFESPNLSSNKCVLLGGLSDGLMPVPYVSKLESVLKEENWSLVQPILSSSYTGFGHGSLDQDVLEIDELIEYLVKERECSRIAMVGHSTGTQDIVHYLKHGKEDLVSRVSLAALQAPVSDRESATVCHDQSGADEHMKALQSHLIKAEDMRKGGQGDEMMPRSAFWAPITANRFLDLNENGGRDDYFSSDFNDDELSKRLSHVGSLRSLKCCLVVTSGSDEYVPPTVKPEELLHRLCQAIDSGTDGKKAVPVYLPTGNHNLSSRDGEDSSEFLVEFRKHLSSLSK